MFQLNRFNKRAYFEYRLHSMCNDSRAEEKLYTLVWRRLQISRLRSAISLSSERVRYTKSFAWSFRGFYVCTWTTVVDEKIKIFIRLARPVRTVFDSYCSFFFFFDSKRCFDFTYDPTTHISVIGTYTSIKKSFSIASFVPATAFLYRRRK